MDAGDARARMAGIDAAQALAVREAARWRWPWWYIAATVALMLGTAVAMDFDGDPAVLTVLYCCGVSLLQIPLSARMRMKLHRSRAVFQVNWPLGALLVAVAAVYVLARVALDAAGAPLPSTLAGLLMAGAYAAGLPAAQQMTARRLLSTGR
ncbi:MAG TPA: hypothetical protein VHV09_16750 [Trebonia sp.]|jgi:cbb3-type cytochrome oxidase subunit 1|nr:hypothetical protein [Trebonia sp.]